MSTSTDHLAALNTRVERRFYPRVTPSLPIYVAFGPSNLGTLLNVSENGLAVVTPIRLDLNSVYRVSLPLDGVARTITVSVRTIWTSNSDDGSGIQLLDLAEQDREQIRVWVALQNSRRDNLGEWFVPKRREALPAATEPAASVLAPETPKKNAFPPMPLPIHGDFTYEPPADFSDKILPPERPKVTTRSSVPSSTSRHVLWTALMGLIICFAAGWPFRQELSRGLLRLSSQVTKQRSPSMDQTADSAVPAAPDEVRAEQPADTDVNRASAPPVAADASAANEGTPAVRKRLQAAAPAPRPNLEALRARGGAPEAPEAPRSFAGDSASLPAVTNDGVPALEATRAPIAPKPSAATEPVRNEPTRVDAAAKSPSPDKPSHESAIAGSISSSARPSDLPTSAPSGNTAASAPASAALGLRANSYVAPKSSSGNPVVQMDVPEARVIELAPPRTLTGTFTGGLTGSFVNLPGERVLQTTSVTMHIQRSVRFPRERIPGERWLWRGHKKVVLGELASRVDPQVPQPNSSGSITVEATIDKDGYVSEVKPLYGLFALLPNVARAVRDWHYEPTYVDDKPVETQAKIEIDFHPSPARANRP